MKTDAKVKIDAKVKSYEKEVKKSSEEEVGKKVESLVEKKERWA